MANSTSGTPKDGTIPVFLEIGKKRTFAGAMEWPGWCRIGRDEASALQSLVEYGPRYARVMASTDLAFRAPADVSELAVVERVEGNATTDFGAPDVELPSDKAPVRDEELRRFQTILQACWRAFDEIVQAAAGRELRKGPRGGGRDVQGIAEHVMNAEKSYLNRLARRHVKQPGESFEEEFARLRREVLDALAASVAGEVPERGPRGGAIWSARNYVRRIAWHVLDHAWEIEDKVI